MKKIVKNKNSKLKTKIRGSVKVKKTVRPKKSVKSKIVLKENVVVENAKAAEAVVKEKSDHLLVLETYDAIHSDEEKTIYYIGISVSAVTAIFFGWQRNFTAAVLFVAMIVVMLMFLGKKPSKITVRLSKEYLWINDEKFNVFNLEYFWFKEELGVKYLNIKIRKSIIPVLSIALNDANINEIRRAFLNFVPEISPEELEEGALENYNEIKKEKEKN